MMNLKKKTVVIITVFSMFVVLLLVLGTLWWGKAQNTIRIRLCGRLVSYFNKSRIRKRLFQNCIEPAL